MSPENVGLGSAPAPAVQTAAVPGGQAAMRPPEYYGSAAHRVITETPRDYPRNVRECCAADRPKIAGGALYACHGFLKQLFPTSWDGSAPHSSPPGGAS